MVSTVRPGGSLVRLVNTVGPGNPAVNLTESHLGGLCDDQIYWER